MNQYRKGWSGNSASLHLRPCVLDNLVSLCDETIINKEGRFFSISDEFNKSGFVDKNGAHLGN